MDLLLGIAFLMLTVGAVILGLAVAIVLVRRDRAKRGGSGSGSLGSAMLELQALFEPEKRHQLEQQKKQLREEDGAGEP